MSSELQGRTWPGPAARGKKRNRLALRTWKRSRRQLPRQRLEGEPDAFGDARVFGHALCGGLRLAVGVAERNEGGCDVRTGAAWSPRRNRKRSARELSLQFKNEAFRFSCRSRERA